MPSFFENKPWKRIYYRTQKNDDCDLHFQHDVELIHVVSGCLQMTVRNETRYLYAGDIMFASSYEPHGFKTVGSSEFRVFILPAELAPEYITGTADKKLSSPFLTSGKATERLIPLLDMLIPYTNTDVTLTAVGFVYAILGTLTEELKLHPTTQHKKNTHILQKILEYINEHFREPIKIADIASHFGYHKDYLSRIFNTGVGCGFNQYVTLLRVKYARELLVKGKLSLDEIAAASGFQSSLTFRRAFTEYFNQSPSEYRKSLS